MAQGAHVGGENQGDILSYASSRIRSAKVPPVVRGRIGRSPATREGRMRMTEKLLTLLVLILEVIKRVLELPR